MAAAQPVSTMGGADLAFRVERSSAWFLESGATAAPLIAAFFEAGAFFFFFATRAIAFGLPPPPFRNDTVCSVNKCLDFDKTRRVLIAVGDETAFSRKVDVTIVLAPFRKLTFVSSRSFAPLELLELLVLFGFAALFFAFVAPPDALAVAGGRAEGKDAPALLLVSPPPPPGPCSLRNGVLDSFALVARAAAAAFILGLLRSAFGFFVDGVADDDDNVVDDDDEEADSDKAVILAVILVSDCRLVLPCMASATDAAVAVAAARDFVVPAGLKDEDAGNTDDDDDDDDDDGADADADSDSTEEGASGGGSLGLGLGLK